MIKHETIFGVELCRSVNKTNFFWHFGQNINFVGALIKPNFFLPLWTECKPFFSPLLTEKEKNFGQSVNLAQTWIASACLTLQKKLKTKNQDFGKNFSIFFVSVVKKRESNVKINRKLLRLIFQNFQGHTKGAKEEGSGF